VSRPAARIALVTPALADANNGNWQTARRWSQMLRHRHAVRVLPQWTGGDEDLLIALHARRSAASLVAWRERHPQRPLLLVLTGTDLYRDIASDGAAQRSLVLADRLVLLNELGARALPPALQSKARVCLQSAPARAPRWPRTTRHLRVAVVGHLREEKDPRTVLAAVALLAGRSDIVIDHLGAALDPALGEAALALAAAQPNYRWQGAQPHGAARALIAQAHVLVHASRLEGGAHVVIEAITSGTPVIASRIDGNLGLLGSDYAGCFEPGDGAGLAASIERARDEPAWWAVLAGQCALRAPLFAPAREQATLTALVDELLR